MSACEQGATVADVVDVMERVDWTRVRGVTVAEAAVWTQRCLEAYDET